ncbi:hypothetical protein MHY87_05780 [Microvirga sp. ACRRW]|uniref:imm11 family protein n=1 Tax=Microvirga sp. ACRRW TaxID=2918205 RepID=UPI001EF6E652|nr:DUF1629 domain-containing protein [Microvirga sp. ACRRW]MCG7392412.1 hypothetical protein [Microvirga sp. ACRRW]
MKAIIRLLRSVLTGAPRYPRKYVPSIKIEASEAYWLWDERVSASQVYPVVVIKNLIDITQHGFFAGHPLPEELPPFQLKALSKSPLPDYFEAGIFRFISARLKRHLEEMQVSGFECRPAHIKHRGQTLTDTHFYFHVYQMVDCFDLVHSTYEMDTGPKGPYISKIRVLHLDESKIGDHPLFHVGTPGAEYNLIVSDALAESLLRSKFIGCGFKLPADIENYFEAPRYKTLSS